jgi:hypothetical protein
MINRRAGLFKSEPGRLRHLLIGGDQRRPPTAEALAHHLSESLVDAEHGGLVADPRAIGRIGHHPARRALRAGEILERALRKLRAV